MSFVFLEVERLSLRDCKRTIAWVKARGAGWLEGLGLVVVRVPMFMFRSMISVSRLSVPCMPWIATAGVIFIAILLEGAPDEGMWPAELCDNAVLFFFVGFIAWELGRLVKDAAWEGIERAEGTERADDAEGAEETEGARRLWDVETEDGGALLKLKEPSTLWSMSLSWIKMSECLRLPADEDPTAVSTSISSFPEVVGTRMVEDTVTALPRSLPWGAVNLLDVGTDKANGASGSTDDDGWGLGTDGDGGGIDDDDGIGDTGSEDGVKTWPPVAPDIGSSCSNWLR